MFQTITDTALLLTFVGIAAHWALYPTRLGGQSGAGRLAQGSVHTLSLLLIEQKSSLLGALKKVVYLVTVLCFLVLALTGFWPLLVRGQHISGYLMMIHATFAPVFALCLAVLAVTWAGSYSFAAGDCAWVQRLLRRATRLRVPAEEKPWRCARLLEKVTFWLLLFLSLPLILSIIVSMFHLLGTDWQHTTLAIHRWTGLAFVIAAILFTYFAIRVRMTEGA